MKSPCALTMNTVACSRFGALASVASSETTTGSIPCARNACAEEAHATAGGLRESHREGDDRIESHVATIRSRSVGPEATPLAQIRPLGDAVAKLRAPRPPTCAGSQHHRAKYHHSPRAV